MSQVDYNIANAPGAVVREDINDHLSAIISKNSGAVEPTDTYSHMWWYDTSTNFLKQRNLVDDAWISIFDFNQNTDEAGPVKPNLYYYYPDYNETDQGVAGSVINIYRECLYCNLNIYSKPGVFNAPKIYACLE